MVRTLLVNFVVLCFDVDSTESLQAMCLSSIWVPSTLRATSVGQVNAAWQRAAAGVEET